MKGHSHAAIGEVESFLHAITMVHVDVEVKYTRVDIQQLYDRQHNVIHIAKTTRLRFFGVVQASSPVDSYVCLSVQQ